jgi:hypothetical protein
VSGNPLKRTEEETGSPPSTPAAVDTSPKRQRGPPRAARAISTRSSLTLRVSMAPGRAEPSLVTFSVPCPPVRSVVTFPSFLGGFFCAFAPWREIRSVLLVAPERRRFHASLRSSGREAHAKAQSRKRDRSRRSAPSYVRDFARPSLSSATHRPSIGGPVSRHCPANAPPHRGR